MLERQVFLFSFLFWNIGWTERPVKPTSENAICRNTYTSHFQRRRFLNSHVLHARFTYSIECIYDLL